MGSVRFADLQSRPTEGLDLTSRTVDELQHLVLPFEAALEAHMADWRLDGQPRTARRYTTERSRATRWTSSCLRGSREGGLSRTRRKRRTGALRAVVCASSTSTAASSAVVHDTCRLWKAGVRDLVMDVCCALHNFRGRLAPWQPMI